MAGDRSSAGVERVYTVPLRRAFREKPRYRRARVAVAALRAFLSRHLKSEDVRIGQHLNRFLWRHGMRNPPPRVTVRAVKDGDGVVRAELEGFDFSESVKPVPKEAEGGSLKDRLSRTLSGGKEGKESLPTSEGGEAATPRGGPSGGAPSSDGTKKSVPAAPGVTAGKSRSEQKAPRPESKKGGKAGGGEKGS